MGKEVRCSCFLEYSHQILQSGSCLSCLPNCFPWLFLGTRSSVTALDHPQMWAKLACLTRTIWSRVEQCLEAFLLVVLDLPHTALPSSASCWGLSYQRREHIRGSAAWESALGVEDKQINVIFTCRRLINHWNNLAVLVGDPSPLTIVKWGWCMGLLEYKIHMCKWAQWHFLPCSKQKARLWPMMISGLTKTTLYIIYRVLMNISSILLIFSWNMCTLMSGFFFWYTNRFNNKLVPHS